MKKGSPVSIGGGIRGIYVGKKNGSYIVEIKDGNKKYHVSTLEMPRKVDIEDSDVLSEKKRWESLAEEHGIEL